MSWVFLVLAYGLIKGLREVFKKKALERNSTPEVLFLYTLLSFLFVIPAGKNALEVEPSTLVIVAFKSLAIFLAWIFSFNSIKHIPISLYGILDLSRILFATLLGVVVMKENLGPGQLTGLGLVATGLLMLKVNPFKERMQAAENKAAGNIAEGNTAADNTAAGNTAADNTAAKGTSAVLREQGGTMVFYVVLTIVSCLLNSVSGVLDKYIMSNTSISDGHLQFWYMLFLVVYYALYVVFGIVRRGASKSGSGFNMLSALKNKWIWLLAVFFVIADRCLFIANANPDSRVTVMTLIKQSCCIVTILAGKLVFREKNILHKLLCAVIIIAGIVISVVL